MLRNLHDSLVDYDLPMLRGTARARGLELEAARPIQAVEELCRALLTPDATEWALARLTLESRAALDAVLRAGGRMKAHLFADRFGAVRTVGPGRLEREKPWTEPLNAAEQLWYMGLVFRAFADVGSGYRAEFIYVPADVVSLLPRVEPDALGLQVDAAIAPEIVEPPGEDALMEDVFVLFVALQMRPLPVDARFDLTPAALRQVERYRVPGDATDSNRFAFACHLCRETGLIRVGDGRVQLDPRQASRWLKWPALRRQVLFQKAWLENAGWNDLWRVPTLRMEHTGWRNDPVLARRAILAHLRGCPMGVWLAIESFVAAVRELDPDFARPDGDYHSWYIRDAASGEYLMEFACWPRVEGALIGYLLGGPLHWLGVVSLGYEGARPPGVAPAEEPAPVADAEGRPTAFLIPAQAGPLWGAATPAFRGEEPPARLVVQSDFTVRFPVNGRLYERFQLARFARPLAPAAGGELAYQITRASLSAAYRQGITPPLIVSFLQRVGGVLPRNVVVALRRWRPSDAPESH